VLWGQAYESGEKQDTEKLAKELDGLEGGRSVDATAVKACVPLLPPPLLISQSVRPSPPSPPPFSFPNPSCGLW
jgi:hypothetical protein